MRMWKVWVSLAALVFTFGLVALSAALWNNLSSEWNVEASAAQFALNRSPLQEIDSHDIFTAAGAQEVFTGADVFGRKWFAFVYGSPFTVKYVPMDGILNKSQMMDILKKDHLNPLKEQVGYLDSNAQATFHTQSDVIWEVYAKTPAGDAVYQYYDARSGTKL
jgi:uncharacterized protein YpmB